MIPQPTAEQIAIHDANNRAMVEAGPIDVGQLLAAVIHDSSLTTEKVEIVERLAALWETQKAQARKERFQEALRLCQMEMPRVEDVEHDIREAQDALTTVQRAIVDAELHPPAEGK